MFVDTPQTTVPNGDLLPAENPTTSKQQEAVNSTEPEFYPKRSGSNSDTPLCSLPTSTKEDLSIKVTDFSASWSYEIEKLVLEKISIEVNKDSPLLAVVGPVGAGKVKSHRYI